MFFCFFWMGWGELFPKCVCAFSFYLLIGEKKRDNGDEQFS